MYRRVGHAVNARESLDLDCPVVEELNRHLSFSEAVT
jgi:hypothetical protein